MPELDALQPITDVIDPLPEAECRRLLGRQVLGRVGMTSGGLPLILPVHYVYYDGVIVFRSDAGTKLPTAANGDVLAFEVDAHDAELGRGWSVMVLGRANVVTTECGSYVRLSCELVTGRVIENDMAGLPLGGNP